MKILVVHNFHRRGSASGDDQVYKSETVLLEANGNEVIRYFVSNDEFDAAGIMGKLCATFGMLWSFKNYRGLKELIRKERPDLVHIHTFFPLLSPSVLYAAKRMKIPVVATLHDTRFICPCSTSLRGEKICNECGDGHYLRMFKYGCFKGSRLQSLIVALIFKYHRIRRSFYDQIDHYICLNDNQIRLLVSVGFSENKISKKYNFVPDADAEIKPVKTSDIPERYVVFYGRIGEEKGVRILMRIWDEIDDIPLVIMGGGPLEDEVRSWALNKDNVKFMGYINHDECLSVVKGCEFVVFPSIWYEGCSMVEIEAQSLGKGLIATDLGFSSEAVEDGYNGYKVPLGNVDKFRDIIRQLWEDPSKCDEIGLNARREYEAKYRPKDNYLKLRDIYEKVIDSK